jgi:3-hydroxymyristoyl/3-hydroxydecanoyl-(acyl carrier protein) dehydratase
MGSIVGRESQDLYFRNLDGEGTLLGWPDRSGGMLTNRIQLLTSSSLDQVIIQKYSFELSWDGELFFQGTSSFGYFTKSMLKDQAGLDGGKDTHPWYEDHPGTGSWQSPRMGTNGRPSLSEPQLPQPERIWVAPQGGRYGNGYLYLTHPISEQHWYFKAHFHQDPVMPGSLGVELMAQALMTAAPELGITDPQQWRFQSGSHLDWKYRGQITPAVSNISLDLHIKEIRKIDRKWVITADGQLWKGSTRIYQVDNLSLESITPQQEGITK